MLAYYRGTPIYQFDFPRVKGYTRPYVRRGENNRGEVKVRRIRECCRNWRWVMAMQEDFNVRKRCSNLIPKIIATQT